MAQAVIEELRTQGRGVTGALLVVGVSMLVTMETWWLSRRLPILHLLVFAAVGLGVVFALVRSVGFRRLDGDGQESAWRVVADFGELVMQSVVAALVVLLAFGVVTLGDSPSTVVRMALVQVVPFGFGAALANRLLGQTDAPIEEEAFPHNLSVFALGAVFLSLPVAPTEEVVVIARNAGWPRLAALVVLSVGVVHLVLHELEFRGHRDRIEGRTHLLQIGTAATAYTVALAVCVVLLLGFGQFDGRGFGEWVQLTVVLGFPAATGASAGEVVL
jgi:putative integral membrane protein (TIGR02587 family)